MVNQCANPQCKQELTTCAKEGFICLLIHTNWNRSGSNTSGCAEGARQTQHRRGVLKGIDWRG